MDRRTAAALITAGVVGVTGGTAAAVLRDPGPGSAGGASGPSATGTPRSTPRSTPGSTTGSSPRSTPSTTPSPSASATPRPRAATVLYAAGGKIHDGATTVGWTAPFRFVRGLTRIPDGYLVAFSGTESEPGLELWKVRPDGTSTKLAAVVGDWDLSPDRTRVVGLATAGLRLTVWSVDDGSVVRVWRKFAYTVSPAFAGDDVVVDPVTPDGTTDLVSWNPDTGRAGRLTPSGLAGMTASLDGRRLAGSIGVDGRTNSQEGTPCLGAARYPAITRWADLRVAAEARGPGRVLPPLGRAAHRRRHRPTAPPDRRVARDAGAGSPPRRAHRRARARGGRLRAADRSAGARERPGRPVRGPAAAGPVDGGRRAGTARRRGAHGAGDRPGAPLARRRVSSWRRSRRTTPSRWRPRWRPDRRPSGRGLAALAVLVLALTFVASYAVTALLR